MGNAVNALAFAIASRRIGRHGSRARVKTTKESHHKIEHWWIDQQNSLPSSALFLQVATQIAGSRIELGVGQRNNFAFAVRI